MIGSVYVDVKHVFARRSELRRHIDLQKSFEAWQETCVPSYCHPNILASYVSWLRLFRAVSLARRHHPQLKLVLDFGSSVGELGQILALEEVSYEFIEQDELAAGYLDSQLPQSVRRTLESAPARSYDCVFAVDALEHNRDYDQLLRRLASKLKPDGILVLSGPTESRLYRLGRALAGFRGGYHVTTIYEIEAAAASHLALRGVAKIFPGFSLFRLSVWGLRN
jgi:2-polyprenyl-3-methyl-5-hydroxy-6-metoxy-1,4-benzoquinol methylase